MVGEGRKGSGAGIGEAAKGLSLAFEFVAAVFLFWFLGRLLDNWLGIFPWGQVAGTLVGWFGGFMHVYYATRDPGGRRG